MRELPVRLLICAGGTGGGVYPAFAVLQAASEIVKAALPSQLPDRPASLEVLWVGGLGGMEAALVQRAGVDFTAIPAAGVHGVGWRALPGNLVRLGQGTLAARSVLQTFRPDVMFFTGGYLAPPVAAAGRFLLGRRIPAVVYVPDIEPGLALKALARLVDQIAVTAEDSLHYFPIACRVSVTGYPVRPDLQIWERGMACQALELSPDLPTVLVMGGSKGARSINQALLPILPQLLSEAQVIHISGQLDWPEVETVRATLPLQAARRYRAFPYLHEEMGAALAAADLAVARAGASTLGEFPLMGLPAVLVPYPHAWRYQQVNAGYLERQGAALILPDEVLSQRLLPLTLELIRDGSRRLAMRQAMRSLAHPEAASAIASLLINLAGGRKQEVQSWPA